VSEGVVVHAWFAVKITRIIYSSRHYNYSLQESNRLFVGTLTNIQKESCFVSYTATPTWYECRVIALMF